MKKYIFNPGNYPTSINIALLILRLFAGFFMLTHSWGKMEKLFGDEPVKFADPIGIGAGPSLALTVFAEVLCSLLLIVGLATRVAAIPLIINFIVIIVVVQAGKKFSDIEISLLYLGYYLSLFISGAGKYSLDH